MSESEHTVTIELSADEAIVLFEYLARTDESGDYKPEHGGEVAALWRLEGALEKKVDLVFSPEYGDTLNAARARLAEQAGTQEEPRSPQVGCSGRDDG